MEITEIIAPVLGGMSVVAAVLLGVWRIIAHYEKRKDVAHAELRRDVKTLGSDVTNLRERMGMLEGEIRGFMAGFQAKTRDRS